MDKDEQPPNLPLPGQMIDPNTMMNSLSQIHEYLSAYPNFDPNLIQNVPAQPGNKNTRKHKFTPGEDETLKRLVQQYGYDWKSIAAVLKNRNARQCRDRWKNYLRPEVNLRPWSPEEDALLIQKYQEFGRQWAIIAKSFPDRTDIHIKNRFTTLSGKIAFQAAANGQMPAPLDANMPITE